MNTDDDFPPLRFFLKLGGAIAAIFTVGVGGCLLLMWAMVFLAPPSMRDSGRDRGEAKVQTDDLRTQVKEQAARIEELRREQERLRILVRVLYDRQGKAPPDLLEDKE